MNNENIKLKNRELLSNEWYKLEKVSYDFKNKHGNWEEHVREVLDRGNASAVLLYNTTTKKVLLTKQFRLPTYINGNEDGMLTEVCAGLLDKDNPEDCIRREILEETGYQVNEVKKRFESYMSPGGITEMIHFFTAEYNEDMKINEGGGLEEEQEQIEVLEMDFEEAYAQIASGEMKDAKTIMLLQYAKINNFI